MWLAGAVVASWYLTHDVATLSLFNNKYFLSLNWANSVKTFRENSIDHFAIVVSKMGWISTFSDDHCR